MKTIRSLVLLSLAMFLGASPAQEANPYLGQKEEKAPVGPSGDSFLTLTEHALVPADILDSWLAGHPITEDASELRAAVQGWIHEGKATLDHSALTAGTEGRTFSNESVLEQIYGIQFMKPDAPGDWPTATSFETRNTGYGSNGDAVRKKGGLVIRAKNDLCKMMGNRAPDKVSEETHHPGDIFLPNFRTFYGSHAPWTAEDSPDDTFTSELFRSHAKNVPPSYPVGKIHLALRADEDLPEPIVKKSPDDKSANEAPTPLPANRLVRLIFVRGDKTGTAPGSSDPLPTDYHVSGKLISVDHLAFSDWLQGRDLATASSELDQAIEKWNEDDKVTILRNISGGGRSGTATTLEDVQEIVYPTEWLLGARQPPGPDGKPTELGLATATSFETRNVGSSLQTEIETDEGGPLLNLGFDRIVHGGFSIHHRVLRDGEWVQDITQPRFSDNRWNTSLRLKRGAWMLVGSGSAFGENSQFDPTRIVLAFVKVE